MQIKKIFLDASHWGDVLDFYKAIFAQIGAPDWHGESVAALVDSMIYGGINQVEPPYTVYINGLSTVPREIADEISTVKSAIEKARTERKLATGIDAAVAIEVE